MKRRLRPLKGLIRHAAMPLMIAAAALAPSTLLARATWMIVDLVEKTVSYSDIDLETAKATFNTDEYKKDKMVFRLVGKGSYSMGYSTYSANSAHTVTMSDDYYIGIFPVTAHQYARMKGVTPPTGNAATMPSVNVSYYTLREGALPTASPRGVIGTFNADFPSLEFDLPTESMWEVAARAGTSGRWFFGDTSSALGTYAWYKSNASSTRHQVGGKAPNQWGLYDVYGNVGEWCRDAYQQKLNTHTDGLTPTFVAGNQKRSYRGGKFSEDAEKCSSYYRTDTYVATPSTSLTSSDSTKDKIGFRLAAIPRSSSISGTVTMTSFSQKDDETWRIVFETETGALSGGVDGLVEDVSFSVRRGSSLEGISGDDNPEYADFEILHDECSVDGETATIAIDVKNLTGPVNFLRISSARSE